MLKAVKCEAKNNKKVAFEIVGGLETNTHTNEYMFNKESYLKGHRLAEEICYLPMTRKDKSQRHIKLTLNIYHSFI